MVLAKFIQKKMAHSGATTMTIPHTFGVTTESVAHGTHLVILMTINVGKSITKIICMTTTVITASTMMTMVMDMRGHTTAGMNCAIGGMMRSQVKLIITAIMITKTTNAIPGMRMVTDWKSHTTAGMTIAIGGTMQTQESKVTTAKTAKKRPIFGSTLTGMKMKVISTPGSMLTKFTLVNTE